MLLLLVLASVDPCSDVILLPMSASGSLQLRKLQFGQNFVSIKIYLSYLSVGPECLEMCLKFTNEEI